MPANDEKYFKEVSIPNGVKLKSAKIHEALIEADVWINVPVLKIMVEQNDLCHEELHGNCMGQTLFPPE